MQAESFFTYAVRCPDICFFLNLNQMQLTISPKRTFLILCLIIGLLVVAHLIFGIYAGHIRQATAYGLVELFDVDQEQNFPTFFAALLLLAAGMLLFIIARATRRVNKKQSWYWLGLAALFTFLSMDEMLRLHERLNEPVRTLFNTSGVLHFAWVIPYSIFILVLAVIYIPFIFKQLPGRIRNLMLASGVIFVSGALGLELLASFYFDKVQEVDLAFALMATVEETMEMLGSSLFIYALMLYLATELKDHSLRIATAENRAARRSPVQARDHIPVN